MNSIQIVHRIDTGRTAVRHYVGGILDHTERMTHDTLSDAMTFAYVTADDADVPVTFFIDGVEFSIAGAAACSDAFNSKPVTA